MPTRGRETENELRKKLFINSECEGKECAAKREKRQGGAGAGAEAEATEMWQGVFDFEKVPKKKFTINRRLCFNTLFMRNFNGKRQKKGVIEKMEGGGMVVGTCRGNK